MDGQQTVNLPLNEHGEFEPLTPHHKFDDNSKNLTIPDDFIHNIQQEISMKFLLLSAVVVLAGCAPYRYTVTGASGKAYTAPDLCAALIQCKNSTEPACYYVASKATQDGKTFDETYCKEVAK